MRKKVLAAAARISGGRGKAGAVLWAAFVCAPPAHAYIDPGSGSALITMILGAIGAAGYTFRKYYYKIKKLFGGRGGKKDGK